ncbi:unnamed protein product [Caenorhabditis auriculariae]|uniref:CCD97-like C-terminal domain-containing protein n=1 Tax=Caenorhabditis auriculariae TaxID=2777116 RepID=A0A8S1GVA3_9PELO|nr:unnamed protein product [Caenorhabditis auriculariae]
MIQRIVDSPDVFYKHQQFDDPELTKTEREDILRDLAVENVGLFLSRYGKYLLPEDCKLFDGVENDVVKYVLKQVRGRKDGVKNVKNRRFNAMQKMMSEPFFSDEQMREREPYLFDVMIGRFLTEEERHDLRPTVSRDQSHGAWSGVLDQFETSSEIAQRRKVQQAEWEDTEYGKKADPMGHGHCSRFFAHVNNMTAMDDEFQAEEEEEDEEDVQLAELRIKMEKMSQEEASAFEQIDDDETPHILRHEFVSYMQERFIAGKDSKFFDYALVDNDDSLDESDPIRERDEEEMWFDQD